MTIFKTQIMPKLISLQIEWQMNSWIVGLNITFWNIVEHSAFFKLWKTDEEFMFKLKFQSVEWLWYHVEIIHLVLTNLPFEKGFYNMKLKNNGNKLCLYVIFLFGLISSTYLLFDMKQHYMTNNFVYYQAESLNITQNLDLSCNNLCFNGTSALDCSKPVLTIDQLQKWIGINWILFVICVGGVVRG